MCILLHKSRIKTQIVFTFPAPGARNWADAGTHTHHTPSTMRKSSLSLRASPKVLPPFNSRRSFTRMYAQYTRSTALFPTRVYFIFNFSDCALSSAARRPRFVLSRGNFLCCWVLRWGSLSPERRGASAIQIYANSLTSRSARTSRTNKRHTLLLYNVGMAIAKPPSLLCRR
jgi:hypothetical protein